MIDLRPDHLAIIRDVLRRYVPDDEVRAFGSRVRWTAKDASDLDLVVMTTKPLEISRLADLEQALSESDLPFRVDVLDWHAISPDFQRIIAEGYEVIQAAGGSRVMAGEWKQVRLGDLIQVKHGYPFEGEFFSDEPSPNILLTPGNFAIGGGFKTDKFKYYKSEVPNDYVLAQDDLIITMTDLSKQSDTLGYPALVPQAQGVRYLHNQRLGKVELLNDTQLDKKYLYYLLRTREYRSEVLAGASGSVIKHTSPERIRAFRFLLPPLPEQRAIAHILGALDNKIELNRRMNATLESMAQAIFRQWFVEGKDIANWEEKPLDEIANYLNGLALQKFPAEGDDYLPVIKISQLRKNDTEGADKASTNIPPVYIIEDGDILFSWSGSLEVVVWCGGRGALNQHLFKVTSEQYPKWFYYFWTKHHLPDFQEIAAGKVTTMGHIQRHHLKAAKVRVPSDKELQEMDKVMSPLLDKIINNKLESCTLAYLRDGLLPRLTSGEIRVKDAENLIVK